MVLVTVGTTKFEALIRWVLISRLSLRLTSMHSRHQNSVRFVCTCRNAQDSYNIAGLWTHRSLQMHWFPRAIQPWLFKRELASMYPLPWCHQAALSTHFKTGWKLSE